MKLAVKNNIQQLDLCGLKCPLPVLKIRNYIKKINCGEKIWVHCDDPLAKIDVPNFCNQFKQKLAQQKFDNNNSWFLIVKQNNI